MSFLVRILDYNYAVYLTMITMLFNLVATVTKTDPGIENNCLKSFHLHVGTGLNLDAQYCFTVDLWLIFLPRVILLMPISYLWLQTGRSALRAN